MKLYQVPRRTWIRIKDDDDATAPPGARLVKAREEIFFDHLDGMYSFCKDKEGNVVHMHGGTEVELV